MKKFLALFILIHFTTNLGAQDAQLFAQDWFLHNLVIEGESYVPPVNDEVHNVLLTFEEPELHFFTSVCADLSGAIAFAEDSSQFQFTELAEAMMECNLNENTSFRGIYYGFYGINSTNWNDNIYQYEITDNSDGSKTLIITDENGNQAIYGTEMLSVDNPLYPKFDIYPNPVQNKLTIENPDLKIIQIKITDAGGKLVLQQNINSARAELDFTKLEKGVYFVNAFADGKILKTEKVLKN